MKSCVRYVKGRLFAEFFEISKKARIDNWHFVNLRYFRYFRILQIPKNSPSRSQAASSVGHFLEGTATHVLGKAADGSRKEVPSVSAPK